jgi:hypothetical protein
MKNWLRITAQSHAYLLSLMLSQEVVVPDSPVPDTGSGIRRYDVRVDFELFTDSSSFID